MSFRPVHTRFRAYQLSSLGSSFSYWDADTRKFTLGEARFNSDNTNSLLHELKQCGKTEIDDLYISSWDKDHCNAEELSKILRIFNPKQILYPGYSPDPTKENQVESKRLIESHFGPPTPIKHRGLYFGGQTQPWSYENFTHNQHYTDADKANDKSVIHMWRTGNISLLSVGDLESSALSERLSRNSLMAEVDVLILSHHGSSPDFTTLEYLKALKPRACLALVDRQNQFDHPNSSVLRRVQETSKYYSTKEGDIIIETDGSKNHGHFTVYNYRSNGTQLVSMDSYICKKLSKLGAYH